MRKTNSSSHIYSIYIYIYIPPQHPLFHCTLFLYRNIETATKTKLFENQKKVSFLGARISKKQFSFCHSFYVFLWKKKACNEKGGVGGEYIYIYIYIYMYIYMCYLLRHCQYSLSSLHSWQHDAFWTFSNSQVSLLQAHDSPPADKCRTRIMSIMRHNKYVLARNWW